jgi:shikimate kinase
LGAVNTVIHRNGKWLGCNTDPDGVFHALNRGGFRPAGQRTLVVGAGGAAAAAALACRELGLSVRLCNRTDRRGERLSSRLDIGHLPWANLLKACAETELLILAAPLPNAGELVEGLPHGAWALEADYRTGILAAMAGKYGDRTILSGLDWLVGQGAAAFHLFTGLTVDEGLLAKTPQHLRDVSGPFGTGHICLIGLPGSGKTTLGRALSQFLGRRGLDLDECIVREQGLGVVDYFARHGEAAFRRRETEALKDALRGPRGILALGGGIVETDESRAILAEESGVVWLVVSAQEALRRTRRQGGRPLLKRGNDAAVMDALLQRRQAHYFAATDLVMDGQAETAALVEGLDEELG